MRDDREGQKRRETTVDIWSYCSHSASQVSTPSDIHSPDTIGGINILWAICISFGPYETDGIVHVNASLPSKN